MSVQLVIVQLVIVQLVISVSVDNESRNDGWLNDRI